MARTWLASVAITDHGIWDPKAPAACAAVVAKVQEARLSTDMRPKIRHPRWPGDGELPRLEVQINGKFFDLYSGDHLVSIIWPNGDVIWAEAAVEDLARLLPPVS